MCSKLPLVLLLSAFVVVVRSTLDLSNMSGKIQMCPAGGRTFMMAWTLACEMKRKRRNASGSGAMPSEFKRFAGYRPATLMEIQKICCELGCEVRDLLAYCDPFGGWNA